MACPNDNDGDGNCGRLGCLHCGGDGRFHRDYRGILWRMKDGAATTQMDTYTREECVTMQRHFAELIAFIDQHTS